MFGVKRRDGAFQSPKKPLRFLSMVEPDSIILTMLRRIDEKLEC